MKRYSDEYKREIVRKYSDGVTVQELSKETGASISTIYSWIKSSNGIVSVVGLQKTIQAQAKKIERLENMIKIIHNSQFFQDVPLSDRLSIIDEIWNKYGINVSCDALCVAHGTFHNHQKRGKGENYLHEKRKKELLPEIIDIETEFKHAYGANKIVAELRQRGIYASKNTVLKIMKEENIHSIRMEKAHFSNANNKKKNVLNRKFNADKPNEAWVSDITYLKINDTENHTYYLCAIMDLFSRKIVAFSVSSNNSKQLVNLTFKKAIAERGIHKDLIFHSDRGANYTSKSFAQLLSNYGIIQSFSKSGTPYDNSVIESFFQNFKAECFNHCFNIKSKKALINIVDEYVNFYNIKRSHSYLNYVSPNKFEENYYKKSK